MVIVSIILNSCPFGPVKIEIGVHFPYHAAIPREDSVMSAQPTPPLSPSEPQASSSKLDAFWMPFTANRQFKSNPRLLARAEGMHYWTADGRQVLDGVAGLWCVNAGHGRREIADAVARQLTTMEYAPTFQMGHPLGFELANRLAE